MANSRTLHLTSMWSLEDQGIPELGNKLKALNPSASIKVEYLRDKHILVVTGQFDEEFDVEITGLLANYIEEHRNDDLLEIPRVRQLPISTYFGPNPLPGHGSDAQPDVGTLVEDIMPIQPTGDGVIVKFWYPSQAGLGPISHDSGPLLLRISEMTTTQITVQGSRELRISAQHMDNIDEAMNTLDSLEECLDLIENPNRGLIIFTPKRENATFRIMTYAQISATALWRILIDRKASLSLQKIMALVVCEFDEFANEFRPLRKLRHPPQLAWNEASITRDWENYHFPEISRKSDRLPGRIDQHLPPKSETSQEKTDVQHPYLSTGKAKDVDKWISRGVPKRPLATDSRKKGPLDDDPTPPRLGASRLPPESSVFTRNQRQSGPFKSNPAGVKGRVIMLPDGTAAPSDQSRHENLIDTPHDRDISLFGRLSYRERNRDQQVAGSSVSIPQQTRPVGILHDATDLTAPSAASRQSRALSQETGPTASTASTYSPSIQQPKSISPLDFPVPSTPPHAAPKQSGDTSDAAGFAITPTEQDKNLASTPRQPNRSISPRVDRAQPLGIAEAVNSQVNTPRGRSVDSVMGEIRLILETAKITRETGTEEVSNKPKMKDQKQPSAVSTGLDLSTEETENPSPLIDLDCEVKGLNSGFHQFAAFDPLVTVPSNVTGPSIDAQRDQFQHGEAPAFSETSDIFDMPNIDDTSMQPQLTQSISLCPGPTQDPMILPLTSPASVSSEPAQPKLATDEPLDDSEVTGSCHESDVSEDEQKHEPPSEIRTKADEVAMEYLLQQIKDNPSPEIPSIEEIALPLDASLGDPAPRGLSCSPRGRAPHGVVQQRQHSGQGSENVPFLHPDLIDISPQMLSPSLSRSSLQQSDSKGCEQGAEPKVDENLAVSEETQTRKFRETMFHQRPSGKDFQWVDDIAKAVSRAHTANTWLRRETTETKSENKANLEASVVNSWRRREESKSIETEPQKISTLPTKEVVKSSNEKKLMQHDSTETLFHFLQPILDTVGSFPGTLSFQIQFGLMFMPSLPASTKEREMSYREIHQLFFSKNNLTPPPISFFQRLTSSPTDINYIIDLEVNQSRLFDQRYSHRGVKYEFWCRVGPNRTIVISVNEYGHAMIRYPEVSLGTVHLSFPSQVWDAAASVQGFIEYITGADPELDEAARMIAKSIRIEPNNKHLRMLVRLPPASKIRIEKAFMERWSRHPYRSERSKDLFLQISETQELLPTASVLDPAVVVFQNAPLEKMVKDGKQWWQASIVSSKVDDIMKSNSFVEPGERNESWCATDLLGSDITHIVPSTADQELSILGAEVGHSGIGAMFQLAKTVVQKIDAVGYWNRGPASIDQRTNTSNDRSHAGTGTFKQSSTSWRKQDVPLDQSTGRKEKHRW